MLNQETSVDRIFRVLADPTRRAIIDHLSRGRASVSDLAKPLDMSLAAVVQHIQALEECGVVRTEKVGRVRQSFPHLFCEAAFTRPRRRSSGGSPVAPRRSTETDRG